MRLVPAAQSHAPRPALRLATLQLSVRGRRRGAVFMAAAGSGPWRFDDLSGASTGMSSTSGVSGFDALWQEQIRGMERAQAEMAEMHRQMDQRFEASQREMAQVQQQDGGSGRGVEERQQHIDGGGGPCGYRWQRSERHEGPGGSYHAFRSESFTVIGVPHGCSGVGAYAAPPSALHLGPWTGVGLLLAAGLAGFWAAATAAFAKRFHLTIYKERSRWWLLLAWPLLLLVSAEFRTEWQQAMRGGAAAGEKDGPSGDRFVPSMPGK